MHNKIILLYNNLKSYIIRLLKVDPENEFGIINNLQVIKRKKSLSKEEIDILEQLEKNSNNNWTVCAVNILLENRHRARKLIDELSEEEQTLFKGFPIYNML